MKKLLALLLAVLMIVGLCACGDEEAETTPSESANSTDGANSAEQNAEVTLNLAPPAAPDRAAFATQKSEFTASVGALVDLSLYEEGVDGDGIYYGLKEEHRVPLELDRTITFSDGSSITMPVTFSDAAKAGLITSKSGDSAVTSNITVPYTTSYGQKLSLWTSVGASTPLSECTYQQATIDIFNQSGNVYTPIETAPEFTVCGSITRDSTIADVIAALGAPTRIGYYSSSDEIYLYYVDQPGTISFNFVASGDYMYRMDLT